jgi:response regulator RpfG family c-di-GMP phosphodiesterase
VQPAFATNQRIADRLLAEGRIDEDDHKRVVDHAARRTMRIEDAIIGLEILSEGDLLKYLATLHGTRFISTEKLMKATIDPRVLGKVTRATADLHGVYPVLLDEATKTLSVVTADPDNGMALDDLKISAGVREVRALVGRPSAVRAAIARDYHGDANAFAIFSRAQAYAHVLDNIQDLMVNPFERPRQLGSTPPPAAVAGSTELGHATAARPPSVAPPVQRLSTRPPAAAQGSAISILETLNVLVSLVENERADLRGHSSTVARLVRKTCERIGIGAAPTEAIVIAAYLHDLGKAGAYHLTALNVSEYEGHRIAALRSHEMPVQLMSAAGLALETRNVLAAMYERFDGQGFPNGQGGKDIPLGARIIAVVDTYADLTQNPRNPYRKILRPAEACDVLAQYRGAVFDPNIVDLFRQAMTGDHLRAKLLADRCQALIIDTDPEETTVLELRMIEQGFDVRIARTTAQARAELEAGEIGLVVSEVDLEEPDAGLTLRNELVRGGLARDAAWVILTTKVDRQTAQRAFDLGVDDFVSKPAATDVFVAKLRQIVERKSARQGARGVSGSLAEMSLPDMIQILWHGRKTGALKLEARGVKGAIYFSEGQVVDAQWDAIQGEDAFYRMLTLAEGDFRLDPNEKTATRTINASPEALLLEGMRRLDEGTA